MTATACPPAAEPTPVALRDIEQALARCMKAAHAPTQTPVQWARMSNLVVFCNTPDGANQVKAAVPGIVAIHPARVILLLTEADAGDRDVSASVGILSQRGHSGQPICSEQITLRASGRGIERLPYIVRGLLISDLPTNLWWAAPTPPPLAGPLLYDLAEHAQQLIYDSLGWTDPHRAVAATASWLARFERGPEEGAWRVASDLSWRRLKYWRRLLAQALDPSAAPGVLEQILQVIVEHGPHAVTQAWQLVGWLASRLRWRVQATNVQPGVQISWQVAAPQGTARLRIHRLAEGPAEVRRMRIEHGAGDGTAALLVEVEDDRRLAALPEGTGLVRRTITVQPQTLVTLVARQLSDRERDPVFRESMAVAQVFAQSVPN